MNHDLLAPLVGLRAPDFTLPCTLYTSVSLRDVRGHPTILVFYPGDWEPVSSQQLRLYQEYLPELEHFDASLIAISVDSIWSHEAFAGVLGVTFPLLSDFRPKGQTSRDYGVYEEVEGRSGRAIFVVDPQGRVCWSHTYPINLNPGVHGILSALERLHVAGVPPCAT